MIQVLHISAECYPAAKTGGLADVVGSLPKYQTAAGMLSAAVIPKYALKWINGREWVTVYGGAVRVDWRTIGFSVQQEKNNTLGFPFFVVDIPGLYDRPGIYNDPSGAPYSDEVERYIVFQQAVLQWLLSFPAQDRPLVLHCHDHHTALIPFMVKHCPPYQSLGNIPTVFTIHNGQYQGMFSWKSRHLLPYFDAWFGGLLEWNHAINPMASALRCAWAVTTVSESYLYELHESSMGLESLFREEWRKQWGIINGIDAEVWDPRTDPAIQFQLEGDEMQTFKQKNKQILCEWFNLPIDRPIISFIGRMVGEKGSDLLPTAYRNYLHAGGKASFIVLGTGETWTQNQFRSMAYEYAGQVSAVIDYNEALAHQIYAGSDFLIMPSRVEPCGLNQLYAMRYGTIPIVRSVGGLKDTVPDITTPDGTGRGIRFDHVTLDDIGYAIHRASSMWRNDPATVAHLRHRIMALDFSWEGVIEKYQNVYRSIGAPVGKPVVAPAPAIKASQTPDVKVPVAKAPKKAPAPVATTAPAPPTAPVAEVKTPVAKTPTKAPAPVVTTAPAPPTAPVAEVKTPAVKTPKKATAPVATTASAPPTAPVAEVKTPVAKTPTKITKPVKTDPPAIAPTAKTPVVLPKTPAPKTPKK